MGIEESNKPSRGYVVGKTYKLAEDMNIRIVPKTSAAKVGVNKWTADARKHVRNGMLKKGTKVTCKDIIKNSDGSIWLRTPSGYICAVGSSGKVFIK